MINEISFKKEVNFQSAGFLEMKYRFKWFWRGPLARFCEDYDEPDSVLCLFNVFSYREKY
jgi:hypothetical protein